MHRKSEAKKYAFAFTPLYVPPVASASALLDMARIESEIELTSKNTPTHCFRET